MDISPPFPLRDGAVAHWERHSVRIYNEGRKDIVNLDALAQYCDCMAMYQEAMEMLRDEGMIRPGERGGLARHPAIMVLNTVRVDMMRLAKLIPLYGTGAEPPGDGLDGFLRDAEAWANELP